MSGDAVFRKRLDGLSPRTAGRGAVALVVGDDFHAVGLPDADARVRRSCTRGVSKRRHAGGAARRLPLSPPSLRVLALPLGRPGHAQGCCRGEEVQRAWGRVRGGAAGAADAPRSMPIARSVMLLYQMRAGGSGSTDKGAPYNGESNAREFSSNRRFVRLGQPLRAPCHASL